MVLSVKSKWANENEIRTSYRYNWQFVAAYGFLNYAQKCLTQIFQTTHNLYYVHTPIVLLNNTFVKL